MNRIVIAFFAALTVASSTEVVQGPSVRTFNVGPSGDFIDSIAIGGAVVNGPTPYLVPPTLQAFTGFAARSWTPEAAHFNYVVPGLATGKVYGGPFIHPVAGSPTFARTFYEPAFYSGGLFPVPYGKAVISGPSGTIVADHH